MPQLPVHANAVTAVPAAPAAEALEYFDRLLRIETDCWDVHASLDAVPDEFVVLDVRSPRLFHEGHVPGARNLPHARITADALREFRDDVLFVVYCSGPHCNGADRAAIAIARLGRPVKKMIGGMTGWIDEGFELERT